MFIDSESGQFEIQINEFPDGDQCVFIPDIKKIPNNILLYFNLYGPRRLEQLILILDMLKGRNISLFTPYLPYSRQDKQLEAGESFGTRAITSLLSDLDGLYTLDCHFMKEKTYMYLNGLHIHNFHAAKYLIELTPEGICLVAPDKGASYLAYGNNMLKTRDSEYTMQSRSIYRRVSQVLLNDVQTAENVLLIDDMIGTGATILEAAKVLKENTDVKNLYFGATHFFGGVGLTVELEKHGTLITTDSVCNWNKGVSVKDIYDKEIRSAWIKNIHD